MKNYLITGGAGFIGSNFILHMLSRDKATNIINLDKLTYAGNLQNLAAVNGDPRYTFIHADICDQNAVERVFSQYSIDCVVNFAAESHVDRSIEKPGLFVQTNVNGTVCLLDAALAAWAFEGGFKPGVKFIQISTDEVYGSLSADGSFSEQTPLDPHSPYSASKAAADLLVKSYYDTYGLPVNITRCSNNYGSYQFLEKLIPLMLNNAICHKELPVYGDGLQVRDWLYVEDHCRAIELVIERALPGEVYNIGGNNERTNMEIVHFIIERLKRHDPAVGEHLIRHVADRKGHDRRYAIDASKLKELGWEPRVQFACGMTRTIDWYLENRAWVEHVTSGAYLEYYERMYKNR